MTTLLDKVTALLIAADEIDGPDLLTYVATMSTIAADAKMRAENARAAHVGCRVKLAQDVERFPVGIFREGETGTIVEANRDHVFVKLDTVYPALAECENNLVIHADEMTADLSLI